MNHSSPGYVLTKEFAVRRRAFSLLEVLVAVVLIAILGSLLLVGINHMIVNSKRQQTRLILQNLTAMYAEYDISRRLPFGMGHLSYNNLGANQNTVLDSIYLACPGSVTTDGSDRYGAGVQYSRDFMAQLLAFSNNAAAISKLPSTALMTFDVVNPTAATYSNAAPYAMYSTASIIDATAYNGVRAYFRTQIYTTPNSADPYGTLEDDPASAAPPAYDYWMPAIQLNADGSQPKRTPVILDAWGNPIICVLGGVLGARPGSAATTGYLTAGGSNFQVHSPDYHLFFASAGPDGDFSKGDDNLYSFEK